MHSNPAQQKHLIATVPGTLPGVSFNVVLTGIEGKELVEFFDTRHKHTEFGQFVSRYYLKTIQDCTDGLDLMGYEPSWKIGAEGMVMALAALKKWRYWNFLPMQHELNAR